MATVGVRSRIADFDPGEPILDHHVVNEHLPIACGCQLLRFNHHSAASRSSLLPIEPWNIKVLNAVNLHPIQTRG
jgi:hypothetical protein